MGPMRSLTGMIEDVRGQTLDVENVTHRMRSANRKLTGGTGEAPTPLNSAVPAPPTETAPPPLMVQLTIEIEKLSQATSALRSEISYLENFSETGTEKGQQTQGYAAQGGLIGVGR